MRSDKQIAQKLRKEGKSYKEIGLALSVPKSTLGTWFAGQDWSKEIKGKLTKAAAVKGRTVMKDLNKVRGAELKKAYQEAREEAARELETLKYNPIFIAGLMLYWGEGDKLTRHHVKLTNTDPKMLKLFANFLTTVCGVPLERVRGQILLYPDLDDWLCRVYWAQETGIPKGNFTKSTVIQGKHTTRRVSFGLCAITVSSTYLKVKMIEWMKLLPGELMNARYYENM